MSLSITEAAAFSKAISLHGYKELYFLKDLVLIPLVLIVIFFILRGLKRKQPAELQSYLMPGFFVKLLAIPLFLIHHTFIYTGGVDQFTYFWAANELIQLGYINPSAALSILTSPFDAGNPVLMQLDMSPFLSAPNESLVIKLTAVIGFLSGNSFLVSSIILSFFSYLGCWKMLVVFNRFFPNHTKLFSFSTIFIPSLIFWTSVISKEVYCIAAMGFLFYSLIRFFYDKRYRLANLCIILISAYLLSRIKMYILLALVVAFLFFMLISKLEGIKSIVLRRLTMPILLVVVVLLLLGGFTLLEDQLRQFALTNLIQTVKTNYDYLSQENFASSRYSLGEIDATPGGVLAMAPAGINVTLFRPYLWEANKPITLIAAIESLLTLCLTLWVLFKRGPKRMLSMTTGNKMVLLCVLFSLIFSLAVGLTSGNFGTLMRYKIPMMPFYFSALAMIYVSESKKKLMIPQE
jgi:hypothetical protein